jgi:hypothetical protein
MLPAFRVHWQWAGIRGRTRRRHPPGWGSSARAGAPGTQRRSGRESLSHSIWRPGAACSPRPPRGRVAAGRKARGALKGIESCGRGRMAGIGRRGRSLATSNEGEARQMRQSLIALCPPLDGQAKKTNGFDPGLRQRPPPLAALMLGAQTPNATRSAGCTLGVSTCCENSSVKCAPPAAAMQSDQLSRVDR